MTAAIFVDTNVFVYARDASEPSKQPTAARWIEQLWIEQRGRTGIQVLNEYYVTVTRKLDPGMAPDDAWDDVRALLAWAPQPVDRDVVLRARDIERRHGLSWWDSMIVAAAQLQSCALLLTEDLQDGWACDGVTVCNPFEARIEDMQARYDATMPAPESRHRPRGRPRRKVLASERMSS
jgi:predicted nucleic acid-binding protein